MTNILGIDFETRSRVDLPKAGLYRYAQDATTDVQCMAWAFDDEPVALWRRGEPLPQRVRDHVSQGGAVRAWNAAFERVIWRIMYTRQGWPALRLEQTFCTMAQAMTQGFPAGLDRCAEAIGVVMRKDQDGRRLMLKLCRPRFVTAEDTVVWHDDETEQRRLGAYCMQDVEVERAIANRLLPMTDDERAIYILDQTINDRGIYLDADLVQAALTVVGMASQQLDSDVYKLTDGIVQNTRKRADLLRWLHIHSPTDDDIDSIDKHALFKLLRDDNLSPIVHAVLQIRLEAMKSSTAKLRVMERATNSDGRIRGQFRYYGAKQTGRWSGAQAQFQNLPRGHIEPVELELAVANIIAADREASTRRIEMLYGPPLDLVASLLRACVIAAPDKELLVADYNAIEARVLAWLAKENRLLEIFRAKGDPYKVMACKVFGCIAEAVTEDMRWIGKQLVLSCGYGTGWETFQERLAKEGVELDDYDARNYIETYRSANPNIVDYWGRMENAAKSAIRNSGTIYSDGRIAFLHKHERLYMKLPSGRKLVYLRPTIRETIVKTRSQEFVAEQIFFWGVNPVTHQWDGRMYTYGAKLVENAVQAISRDILAAAMRRCEAALLPVILHVHDEIVAEVQKGSARLAEFIEIVATAPAWIGDCPLLVKGWSGPRYRK